MDTSDLANRMKEYEKRNQYYLQKRIPVAIRVDGRSFHTFTKGFQRPFDKILMTAMQETAKYMCENIQGAKFAYVQSDEITIILVDYDTLETDCWFNYRMDKLCSISASMATMVFNKYFTQEVDKWGAETFGYEWYEGGTNDPEVINTPEWQLAGIYSKAIDKGAMFDARCFNIPKEEVANLIYWRQLDATRNSIQMVGQANFSHKDLQCKSCNEIQDMLLTKRGVNWNWYPASCKRGSACFRVPHLVRKDENVEVEFKWKLDEQMPVLKENWDYVNKFIFVGE